VLRKNGTVSPQYAPKLNRNSPTPEEAIARLVLMYARNVRSDARWSRATLPEFSSRNSTHFLTLQKGSGLDERSWFCCEYMHCKFGESELVLSLDSLSESGDDNNSVSAEKLRLKIGDREHDGPLSS
jgi:hypothetical protein